MPSLTETVCANLNRVRIEHDLSTRELSARSGMPQKTLHSLLNATHIPRLDTVDGVCKALLVSPHAVVTPGAPINMLMSRRIGRLVETFATLDPDQRDEVEKLITLLAHQNGA